MDNVLHFIATFSTGTYLTLVVAIIVTQLLNFTIKRRNVRKIASNEFLRRIYDLEQTFQYLDNSQMIDVLDIKMEMMKRYNERMKLLLSQDHDKEMQRIISEYERRKSILKLTSKTLEYIGNSSPLPFSGQEATNGTK